MELFIGGGSLYKPVGDIGGVEFFHETLVYKDANGNILGIATGDHTLDKNSTGFPRYASGITSEVEAGLDQTNILGTLVGYTGTVAELTGGSNAPYIPAQLNSFFGITNSAGTVISPFTPEVVASGTDLSSQWNAIVASEAATTNKNLQYSPLGYNSNYMATTALIAAGITPPVTDITSVYWAPSAYNSVTGSIINEDSQAAVTLVQDTTSAISDSIQYIDNLTGALAGILERCVSIGSTDGSSTDTLQGYNEDSVLVFTQTVNYAADGTPTSADINGTGDVTTLDAVPIIMIEDTTTATVNGSDNTFSMGSSDNLTVAPGTGEAAVSDTFNATTGANLTTDTLTFEGKSVAGSAQSGVADTANGFTYTLADTTLTIAGGTGGDQLTLTNFVDGDFGITITKPNDPAYPADPRDPQDPPRIPSKAIQQTTSQADTSMTDPIVFDMSGNGIQLTPLASSTAYFDLHGTGVAEHTGWVGPTTGILVDTADPTSITNLFQGFTALQALAGSGNTVINSSTPGWNSLYIWQDANGNGVADPAEVKSLSALGITSISLAATPVSETINGNTISEVATFSYANGTTHQVAEAFFDNSNLDTIYSGTFTLNPETLLLPDLRGYGNTKDLYIAMSLDPTLLTMVDNFANQTATSALSNISALYQQITNIIYEWTGVTGVNPTSRGPYVNAQQLEAIESILGQPYISTLDGGVSSPNPQSLHLGQTFDGAWQTFFNATVARLLIQGPLASIFPGVQYNYSIDDFSGTMNVTALASAIAANSPTDALAASQYWGEMITIADTVATAIGVSVPQVNTALETAYNGLGLALTWAQIQPGNYVFGTGEGNVSYQVYQNNPGVLALGAGITASNITLQADSSGDLTVSLSSGDSITFQNDLTAQYDPLGLLREGTNSVISQIDFSNGTSLQINQPSTPNVFTWNSSASNTAFNAVTYGNNVIHLSAASGDTVSDAGINNTVVSDDAASSGNTFNLSGDSTATIGGTQDTVNISNTITNIGHGTAVSITGSSDSVNINGTGYYDVVSDSASSSHNTFVDDSEQSTIDTLNGAYDTITLENLSGNVFTALELTVNSAGNNETVNLPANIRGETVNMSGSNSIINEAGGSMSEANIYTITGTNDVANLAGFDDEVILSGTTNKINISGSNSWNNIGLGNSSNYFGSSPAGLPGIPAGLLEIILYGDDSVFYLNKGAQTTITGNNGSIIVSNISNSTLSYTSGSTAYIGGTNDTVNLAGNASATAIGSDVLNLSGTGGNATLSGTNQTASITSIGTSDSITVSGTSNTVSYTGIQSDSILVDGSSDTVNITGANSSPVTLEGTGNIANIKSSSTSVTLDNASQNDSVVAYGANETIALEGGSDTATIAAGANNVLVYTSVSNGDTIVDQSSGSNTFNIRGTFYGNYISTTTITGGTGSETYALQSEFGQVTINNQGTSAPSGVITLGYGATNQNLWFQKVGNNLQILLMDTPEYVTINNWFASAGAQVQNLILADGTTLAGTHIANLVAAMATYAAANPSFNPATATQMPTNAALASAITAAWALNTQATNISGTAATIAAALDTLEASAKKGTLATITLTDTGTPTLSITYTQLINDAAALATIKNTSYDLSISGVSVTNTATVAATAHVTSFSISDSSTNVLANITALLAASSKIASIALTDTGTPAITLTAPQLTADTAILNKITSAYNLTVSGVTAANVASVAAMPHVKLIQVTDTLANVLANVATIEPLAAAGKLNAITLTDSPKPTLSILDTQLASDSAVLAAITSPYLLALTSTANNDSISINVNSETANISGTSDTVIISSGNDSVSTTGNSTNIYDEGTGGNTITMSGTDDTGNIYANNSAAVANGSSETIWLIGNADTATVAGTGNTANIASGYTDETVNIKGTGVSVFDESAGGNTFVFGGGSTAAGGSIIDGEGLENYEFLSNFGQDSIFANGENISASTITFGAGVTSQNLWFQQVGNDLLIRLIGTNETVTISSWFYTANAQVKDIALATGGTLLAAQVQGLAAFMASYIAANPSFNPATATQMPTNVLLQAEITAAWTGTKVNVFDTASDVAAEFNSLQTLAANGTLGSITLTDSGTPTLTITDTQFENDTAVFAYINSPYNLDVSSAANDSIWVSANSDTAIFTGNSTFVGITGGNDAFTVTGTSTTVDDEGNGGSTVTLGGASDSGNIYANNSAAVANGSSETIWLLGNADTATVAGTGNTANIASGHTDETVNIKGTGVSVYDESAGGNTFVFGGGSTVAGGSIIGGEGLENYEFLSNFGQDSISANGENISASTITFGAGVKNQNLWFQQVDNDLLIRLIGTNETVTITNWFYTGNAQVKNITLAGGGTLVNAQVQNLVNYMAAYIAANPSFNTATATQVPANALLQAEINAAWTASKIALSDKSANIASELNSLQTLAANGTLGSITLTDLGTPTLSITNIQLTSDVTALSKITSAYNLAISGVIAANVSTVAANTHVTSIAVSDTAVNVVTNIAALQALGTKLTSIALTNSGTPTLSITGAQFTADGTAIGKITTAYNLSVSAVKAANAATVGANTHVTAITISDTAADVVANIAALQALSTKLTSITLTDSATPNLAITSAQLTADATALGKITSAYNLSVSAVLAANASSTASKAHVTALSVSDTAANIVTNLTALQTLATSGKLTVIAVTNSATPLSITAAQLAADATALGKITGTYSLAVSGVTAANAASTGANTHVTSIIVSDTAANVLANLAALQALSTKLSSITLTNSTTPTLAITGAQLIADATALGKITSAYTLTVSAVLAANATAAGANTHVTAITVADTAANIATNLATLQALSTKLIAITVMNTATPLAITAAQLTADAVTLAKITSAYSLTVSAVTAANAASVTAQAHVTSVSVSDTAANIVTNLAALQTLSTKLTAITLTNTGTPSLAITDAQLTADAATLAKITSPHTLAVSAVTGTGNSLTLSNDSITLASTGASATITGNGNTIAASNNDTVTIIGTGNTANLSGTGTTAGDSTASGTNSYSLTGTSAIATLSGSADNATVAGTSNTAIFSTTATGTGTATLSGTNAIVELKGTSSEKITFASTTAELKLDAPAGFSGTVAGMEDGDRIDLSSFLYSGTPTISSVTGTGAAGTTTDITIHDGSVNAMLLLLNQYANQFAVSSSAYTLTSDGTGSTPGTLFQLAAGH